jgi:hypothetical protein
VLLGRFCATLRAKIENMTDIHLEDWQGDHLPARQLRRGCRAGGADGAVLLSSHGL